MYVYIEIQINPEAAGFVRTPRSGTRAAASTHRLCVRALACVCVCWQTALWARPRQLIFDGSRHGTSLLLYWTCAFPQCSLPRLRGHAWEFVHQALTVIIEKVSIQLVIYWVRSISANEWSEL